MFCKIINFSKCEVKKSKYFTQYFCTKVCSKLSFFTIVVDNIDKYARFFYSFIKLHKYILTKNFKSDKFISRKDERRLSRK